jgi:hypothetical protein
VCKPFYDLHVIRIERIQRRLIRYALRRLKRLCVDSPGLLSLVNVNSLRYRTQRGDFLRVDCRLTNYRIYELLNGAV